MRKLIKRIGEGEDYRTAVFGFKFLLRGKPWKGFKRRLRFSFSPDGQQLYKCEIDLFKFHEPI